MKGTLKMLALAAALGLATSAVGQTTAEKPLPEASIRLANRGGIADWRVIDPQTVLIQGRGRQWYKATLLGACTNLPFVERLGFKSNRNGSFDKFSSIEVRGQQCPLVSLVKTEAPPTKKKAEPAAPPATS